MILLVVSMITLTMLYHILARFEFQFIYLLYHIISVAWQAWHRNSKMNQPLKYQEMRFFPLCMTSRKTFQRWINLWNTKRCVFFLFAWHLEKHFRNYCIQKTKMPRSINNSFVGWSQSMVTIVNLIDKLHSDLANWSVLLASHLTC